jgi:hypothetical protein
MAEKSCVKRLQKEYRALCKVCFYYVMESILCYFHSELMGEE